MAPLGAYKAFVVGFFATMTIPRTPRPTEKELALRRQPVAPGAPRKPPRIVLKPRRLVDLPVQALDWSGFSLPPPAVSSASTAPNASELSVHLSPTAPNAGEYNVQVMEDMAAAEDSRDAPTELYVSDGESTRDTDVFTD